MPALGGVRARAKGYLERNEFLRHVLTLMSGTAIAQALPIVTALVLGRLYTGEEMGVYTTVMAVASALIPIAALRYDVAIVLPENDADARQLVRLATVLNTGFSIIVTIGMIFLGGPLSRSGNPPHPQAAPYFLLCGLIVWSWAQFTLLNYWANRRKNYRLVSHNAIINSTVTNGGQVLAGLASFGPLGLLLATLLGEFVAVGHSLRTVYREVMVGKEPEARSYRELMREYRKMPLLNLPNALVDQVRLQGIPISLSILMNYNLVGQFGMAWRLLSAPMAVINGALSQVFFQRLSRTPRGRMLRAVRMSMVRSAALGVIPFTLIYFLGPWLLPRVLSSDPTKWHVAGQITAILVPWLFMNFITSPISQVFVVVRRQGTMLAFAIIFAAVPLSLIWWQHTDILHTMRLVSFSMAAMLLIFLILAWSVAAQFDKGAPQAADTGVEHDQDMEVLDAENEIAAPQIQHEGYTPDRSDHPEK